MEQDAAADTAPDGPSPVFGTAQRIIESAVIALATSTGLYLVGSVYTDAYYGRMSIEVNSLDLAPPFIALQSAHVLGSLLEYPSALLFFYLLYRSISSRVRWARSWYDRAHRRFGRLFLLIVNLLIVSPLLAAALQAGIDAGITGASSVLGEVAGLMGTTGTLLLFYVIWLSFGPRADIISQIRQRKIIPIGLLAVLYLLDALIATANGAARDAELLLTGEAESSIEVDFTLAEEVRDTLPDTDLLLVTARNGNYYVVERQDLPPSRRPVAYVVPFISVDSARMQRVNEADTELPEFLMDEIMKEMGTPIAP
ncbi:MAG: hypothetical protein KY456_11405 [Chloroflexi bacterium]|nr:hypothetical protein [Chloroflexota bacterium]